MALDAKKDMEGRIDFAGALLHRQGVPDDSVALSGALTWKGNLDRPAHLKGRLDLEEMVLRQAGWEVHAARPLRMGYSAGGLDVEQLVLETPVGPLQAMGRVGTDSLDLAVVVPALNLEQVIPPMRARGQGHLHLSGTLARPRAQGEVDLRRVYLDTLPVGDVHMRMELGEELEVGVEWQSEEKVQVEARLSAPAKALLGRAASSDSARLEMVAHGAELGALLTYALERPVRGRLDLRGGLALPLVSLDTSLSWRALSGRLVFEGLGVEVEGAADSVRLEMVPGGEIAFAEQGLELNGLQVQVRRYDQDRGIFRPAGSLRLAGSLPKDQPAQVHLEMEELDLAVFDGPEGTAVLRARLGGFAGDLELEADLEVETEDLGRVLGHLRGRREGADLHLNWTTLLEDSLVVRGRLPWDLAQGRLALDQSWLQVHSEGMGLFVFSDQSPYLDHLDGRVSADVRVQGLDSTMTLQGYVGVESLEFALLDIKPVYTLPAGRLEFSGRRGELRDCAGRAQPGYRRLDLSGHLDLESLEDPGFFLRLEAENLACRYEDIETTFRADDIDLDLVLEGALTHSLLRGSAHLTRPRSETVLVVFNAPPVPPPPPALRDEFLENMSLRVLVDIRDLEVDSELAQVKASGGVEVSGTFYKPVFQGDMLIDEGKLFLLNRPFDFQEGRIVLNSLGPTQSILDVAYDPLVLDPELDMKASTQIRAVEPDGSEEDYTVTLTIKGRAQSVAPEFTSTPALDFNGIFNLLAFGSVSTQNYTAALGTAAGQLLSKKVEKVGLDEFTVLPSSTLLDSEPGVPAIRMGKYFDDIPFPLWVRYEATVKQMSWGEVRVEHRLTSYLTLTGSAQSKYDRYGLGIGLKKDF
jgi:hypothetical protein